MTLFLKTIYQTLAIGYLKHANNNNNNNNRPGKLKDGHYR